MKHLIILCCVSFIFIRVQAFENAVPLETVYKYLIDKNSNKSDSEFQSDLVIKTSQYIKSSLNINQPTPIPFTNDPLKLTYIQQANNIFRIDTTNLNFERVWSSYIYNTFLQSELINENDTDFIGSKYINYVFKNYKNQFIVNDTSLREFYIFCKKELNTLPENTFKYISLVMLEIFISHNSSEPSFLLNQRLRLLENTFTTVSDNYKLAEIYYNWANVLIDSKEEDLAYNYYYKSYYLGLKDFNVFSKQSGLSILKRINKHYNNLIFSSNSPYEFLGSSLTEARRFIIEYKQQQISIMNYVYFNPQPLSKLDIEYSLALFNTIMSVDFSNYYFNRRTNLPYEKINKIRDYSISEIVNLLEFARLNLVELDKNIVTNSLTNIASYFRYNNCWMHVYSSFAAFESVKLKDDNYDEYTNLYKMFCDASGRCFPIKTGVTDKFINNGIEIFNSCKNRIGVYKMLSSKMLLNLTERKFDLARAFIDSLQQGMSREPLYYDESKKMLLQSNIDYYNELRFGKSVLYDDVIHPNKDTLLSFKNPMFYLNPDGVPITHTNSIDKQYNFLESIKVASNEIVQQELKRDIEEKTKQIISLNNTIRIKNTDIDIKEAKLKKLDKDYELSKQQLSTTNQWLKDTSELLANASSELANIKAEKVNLLKENKIIAAKNKKAEDNISTLWTRTYIILGVLAIAILGLLYFIMRYLKATVFEAQFIQKRLLYHQFKSDIGTFSAQLTDTIDSVKDILKDNNITDQELEDDLTRLKNYSTALFDYFRSTIINSKADIQPLSFEIENVSKYVTLHNSRSNMQVELKLGSKLQTDMNNCKFPTNLLQPIIENAIVHGFKNRPHDYNQIIIDLVGNGRFKTLSISDNGNGINKLQMKQKIETQNKKTPESENDQKDTDTSVSLKDIEKYLKNLQNRFKTRVHFSIQEIQNNANSNGALVQFKNIKQW